MSNYKNLSDLGVEVIRCDNKEGCECLKGIQYKVNQLLYDWKYVWLSAAAARWLAAELGRYREELLGIRAEMLGKKCYPKYVEIGRAVSKYIKVLEEYAGTAVYDPQADRKVLNRLVAEWIKVVRSEMPLNELVALAERNKLYAGLYNCTIVKSFYSMQNEILEEINERLKI